MERFGDDIIEDLKIMKKLRDGGQFKNKNHYTRIWDDIKSGEPFPERWKKALGSKYRYKKDIDYDQD